MSEPSRDADVEGFKRAAALAAVAEVEEGMIVGLGTGTTAAYAISALADRVAGGLRVTTVATSLATARTRSMARYGRSRVVAGQCCARRSSPPPAGA